MCVNSNMSSSNWIPFGHGNYFTFCQTLDFQSGVWVRDEWRLFMHAPLVERRQGELALSFIQRRVVSVWTDAWVNDSSAKMQCSLYLSQWPIYAASEDRILLSFDGKPRLRHAVIKTIKNVQRCRDKKVTITKQLSTNTLYLFSLCTHIIIKRSL